MIEIKDRDRKVLATVGGESLINADLSWANLHEADLREADLREADLHKANLHGANLREADLRGADLSWADLSWADLSEADLREADLHGADLYGADLREANLRCRQYVCAIRGSRDSIVAIDDDVRIGCHRRTLAEWLENYQAIGHEEGYTDEQIAEYGGWLKAIAAILEARKIAASEEEK